MDAINSRYKKIVENLIEMKDVVVPILGDDIFYVMKEGERKMSIHEYLLESFVEEYGENGMTKEDKAVVTNGFYYGLSKLERFFPDDFETDYRCYIRKANKQGWIRMEDTIKEFLEAFRFPLLITTSPFNFIREQLTTQNYVSYAYSPKSSNTERLENQQPLIYHIFGTVADGAEWVFDEDKLLEFLHSLHNEDTTSKGLRQYMESKNCRLLAIGCNLPDWLFRFLWYPIKSGSGNGRQKKGYWINSREITESFNDFLDNINFYTASEVKDILSTAVALIKDIEQEEETMALTEGEVCYDGFLSYASEDYLIAKKLFNQLTDKGYKIWFDKKGYAKLEAGDKYMRKIKAGLAVSKYYIPLITGKFLKKIRDSSSNLSQELDLAKEHYASFANPPERYSVPVLVEGSIYKDENLTSTPVTSALVEGWAKFEILPRPFFWQINMYSYSTEDTSIDFTL